VKTLRNNGGQPSTGCPIRQLGLGSGRSGAGRRLRDLQSAAGLMPFYIGQHKLT
jgi:hypothetical protein